MVFTVFVLVVVLMIGISLLWVALRSRRIPSPARRWTAVGLAGVFGVLLLAVAAVIGFGLYRFYAPRDNPASALQANLSAPAVARGQHLADVVCSACHSASGTLPLSGGKNLSDDIGLPLGNIYPPNLTPAGEIANWTDGEVARAIREGVHKNGRTLAMPVQNLRHLSDDDLTAIMGYLRTQPSVAGQTPENYPTALAAALIGAGVFPVGAPPVTEPVVAPPPGPTAAYGGYFVSISDCRDCHGPNLDGHPTSPAPVGPNLRIVSSWSEPEFANTMRTGVTPSGHELADVMPWRQIGRLHDDELSGLYQYLKALPR